MIRPWIVCPTNRWGEYSFLPTCIGNDELRRTGAEPWFVYLPPRMVGRIGWSRTCIGEIEL